jgi:hypothetical protein
MKAIYLFIVLYTPKGMESDHRDTNRLNNQRFNLWHYISNIFN